MKATMMAVLLFVAAAARAQQTLFCPLEKLEDNFECRSRSNSFKCAAFFVGLNGDSKPISWIGAVPDALAKQSTRENKEFLRSFGLPVSRKSFLFPNQDQCSAVTANSRCYAFMQKASQTPLDSCETTILNEVGTTPVGDQLCAKAQLHAPAASEQVNVDIAFYYSACGNGWEPINNGGSQLKVVEPICCRRDNSGVLKFARCNGGGISIGCQNSGRR